MKTVGQVVRARRAALDLTLAVLAERVGATKSYLSMIENQRVANPPSRELLESLERALEMEAGELREVAGWQSAPPEVRRQVEQLADDARRGRELAAWLRASTSRRAGGGKNLDKLYRSGQLGKRINQALGAKQESGKSAAAVKEMVKLTGRVPLINKVAAGYPRDFTDLDYPASVADEYVPCPIDDPDAFAATVCGESMQPMYQAGDVVVFSPAAEVVDGSDCFVRLEPSHESTFKRVFLDEAAGTIRLQPLNPKFPAQVVHRENVAGMYRAVWRMSKL